MHRTQWLGISAYGVQPTGFREVFGSGHKTDGAGSRSPGMNLSFHFPSKWMISSAIRSSRDDKIHGKYSEHCQICNWDEGIQIRGNSRESMSVHLFSRRYRTILSRTSGPVSYTSRSKVQVFRSSSGIFRAANHTGLGWTAFLTREIERSDIL